MNTTVCQSCGSAKLEFVFSAGFLPAVNTFYPADAPPVPHRRYPANLLRCGSCTLVQLGYEVNPNEVFPASYSYRSGTTKTLKDNFADLTYECVNHGFIHSNCTDLVVDVGCNDGTLLKEFKLQGCRTQGVEPTNAYKDAHAAGIEVIPRFFDAKAVDDIVRWRGPARLVTATNVFAHCPDPLGFLRCVNALLAPGGTFAVEVHNLTDLLRGVQYDTIYHEHLRYYSLTSLSRLLEAGGFVAVHAKRIPTHGGSLRVYAVPKRQGNAPAPSEELLDLLDAEENTLGAGAWESFRFLVTMHKLSLWRMLDVVKRHDGRVFGIGCPSRAVTLVNYCGLDERVLDCVCEVPGSPKVGHYVPGTLIPVVHETLLHEKQPDFALLLSWHLADELIPKLKAKGFRGRFIVPLPEPKVVD